MATRNIRKNRSMAKINTTKHIVTVFRSNQNILAQVLEPVTLRPLFTANSYKSKGTKTEKSSQVGKAIADFLSKNNISEISFNRNGYLYHGRVKTVADSMRDNKINF
jgi:large subunit ribosomal protein L18